MAIWVDQIMITYIYIYNLFSQWDSRGSIRPSFGDTHQQAVTPRFVEDPDDPTF